jgi:hypothetical protein
VDNFTPTQQQQQHIYEDADLEEIFSFAGILIFGLLVGEMCIGIVKSGTC